MVSITISIYVIKEQMAATQKKKAKRGGRRPGAGRPAVLSNPTVLTLRLEEETVDELARLADAESRALRTYVREVLEAHVGRKPRGGKRRGSPKP